MTKMIQTSITIHASTERVWDLLLHFEKYPDWNPFIKAITGKAAKGKIINVQIQLPESKQMTFKPRVLVVDKNKELKWKGKLLFKGLFDGVHQFLIIDNGDGTVLFQQNENFSGLLVNVLPKSMYENTEKGFNEMNDRLKVLAEKKASV